MRISVTEADELISRWIEPNPYKPGPADAGILGSRLGVWVLIQQLEIANWDVAGVAEDYEIPAEAVETAIAYYERHQDAIDARIARNRAFFAAL